MPPGWRNCSSVNSILKRRSCAARRASFRLWSMTRSWPKKAGCVSPLPKKYWPPSGKRSWPERQIVTRSENELIFMLQLVNEKENYLAAFKRLAKTKAGQDPAWLAHLREEAAARFEELDFPTTRHEEWKYTNIAPILKI